MDSKDTNVPLSQYEFPNIIQLINNFASLAMIFGGVFPYIPQYRMINRSRNTQGFSTYVCLSLLMANILRLLFWFGHPFSIVLVIQSIVMITCMLLMLELCVRFKNDSLFAPNVTQHRFLDFNSNYFWKWNDFSSYAQFLIFVSVIGSFITWLFINVTFYVELIGFLSVFTEAMLGAPQFYRNFINKSTDGMSISMVVMWTSGDLFKTVYFILTESPVQFWLCGMLQVSIDIAILFQVWYFSRKWRK